MQDFGHAMFPEYAGRYGWVFVGDILAPAINARGEPADLGDAVGVDRFDSVNSRGAAGFILNEANFSLHSALAPTALVTVSFNLVPRTGNDFRLGDLFDLDLAQIEWLPGRLPAHLDLRGQDRLGRSASNTGSARRSSGSASPPRCWPATPRAPPWGSRCAASWAPSDWLVVAAALTNGSNTIEAFHFYDETDSNAGKTLSGRVSARLPLPDWLELGLSGSWGAQDRALSSGEALWFFGPDLLGHFGALDLKAQWLTGGSPGDEVNDAYGLDLHGGRLPRGGLHVRALLRGPRAASNTGTPSCGWAASGPTSPSPGGPRWGPAGSGAIGPSCAPNTCATANMAACPASGTTSSPAVWCSLIDRTGEHEDLAQQDPVGGGGRWRCPAARAAAQAPPGNEVSQLRAELARLDKEVREQKQLILQLMQVDQQRYDMLLQIIRSMPGAPSNTPASVPGCAGAGQERSRRGVVAGSAAATTPMTTTTTTPPAAAEVAMVSGRVQLADPSEEAYVYVEGRGSARPRTVEIRQEGKQFTPAVTVVPVGSRITFPNGDSVFHNVFSRTPGTVFDLGTVKGGESSPPVTLLTPGHVEVFCNIHSKMRADILVVPNGHYTRVRPDGTFVLANVPVGNRKLVVWGPRLKPLTQSVDVRSGVTVKFAPDAARPAVHLNKQGRAYPSYE